MASYERRKVTLKSSDGEEFLVEEAVAMESRMIRYMIWDGLAGDVIELPGVKGKFLSMIIDFCKKRVAWAAGGDGTLEGLKSDFVKVDLGTLIHLSAASFCLKTNDLVDLTSQTLANRIQGKTIDEICRALNPEE
ncbi:SKP1-like protein 1B isoform X1 [Phalaenopsis equestris]|uniref:SKP1-like protein 1B isoform X1 n=1 Tax=Phalaenopsis equestris TaxID=78828 RepID=UPI0009E49151|nr:SKP1-like protein 1B isoform X1 [Phalaenopsis equestris]